MPDQNADKKTLKTRLQKMTSATGAFFKAARKFLTTPEQYAVQLSTAIRAGNAEKLAALIADGAPLNPRGFGSEPPLAVALEAKRNDMLVTLLAAGANPNAEMNYGMITPFIEAARTGNTEAAASMLAAPVKADVRKADTRGDTPLALAVSAKNAALADILLEAGAPVDARNRRGWTPLFYAAWRGDDAMVQKLLDKGARTDYADCDGHSVLDVAAMADKPATRRLIQGFIDAQVPAWQKADDETLSHVSILRDAGYRLTEVFNFKTERYAAITHNFDTGRDTTVIKTFADMGTDKTLTQAREQYAAAKKAATPKQQAAGA